MPTKCEEGYHLNPDYDDNPYCLKCHESCLSCNKGEPETINGFCDICVQGFTLQPGQKECKANGEKLSLEKSEFDSHSTSIRLKFKSRILVKNSESLIVFITSKDEIVKIKITSVKILNQELILILDFKETENFKKEGTQLDNETIEIITSNMEVNFKG